MAKCKITNEEEALAAVRRDAWALHYVLENLMTAEPCLEAMKSMFEIYIPEPLRDEVRRRMESSE